MNVVEYMLLFHRKRSGQLRPEDEQALERQALESNALFQDMEKVWQTSSRYKESYAPDEEAGLARFQQRLQLDRAAAGRPTKLRPRRRPWLSVAAAVAMLVLAGWWLSSSYSGDEDYAFSTELGQTAELQLPDGSSVILNELSTLSYTDAPNQRKLLLSGEAYFEVEHNPARPFVIEANGTQTTVLGTAFNLRAYPEEGSVEVEVATGKVRLQSAAKAIELSPYELGVFHAKGGQLSKSPAPLLNAQAWRTRQLVFRNESLGEALRSVSRLYHVELKLQNAGLLDCKLSTQLQADEPLSHFLQVLEAIYGLKAEKVNEQSYQLEGGRCR